METVEKVSEGILEHIPTEEESAETLPAEITQAEREAEEHGAVAESVSLERAWNDALAAGVEFLGKLGQADGGVPR